MLTMFSLNDRLVGTGHGGVPVKLMIKDHEFHIGFKKILVVWKWKIQCIELSAFGDGMEIIEISDKPFMIQQVREECLLQAIVLYKEYNEESDSWTPYAYQFPKSDQLIEEINSLIPSSATLVLEDKFVVVQYDEESLAQQPLQVLLQHNWKRWVLSFLYGLWLLYGKWVWEWEAMEIRLPLQWSILEYQWFLERLQKWYIQQWYAIQWKVKDWSMWQWYEIVITDWEILEQFALRQGVEWPLPGRERAQYYQSQLLSYLKMEHTPWDVMKIIQHGLLKLWKK